MTKTVAIVGAGASGLPAIRHALLYGFHPVAFESSDDVGGLWRYKPHETDESSVMKSTVINTSKEMTAYSDFPPPAEFANFMHNRQMLRYFKMYAEHYGLYQYIRFQHTVLNVERTADYATSGRWLVSYTDTSGKQTQQEFDAVLLCTGHHTKPYFPEKWPGQDRFQGRISHAHSYKDHRGFEDKTVVVVGIGNSAIDIAVEQSRIAEQVYLSTRRGAWVYNRVIEYGMPYDLVLFARYLWALKTVVPSQAVQALLEFRLQRRFDHAKYGLKPAHGVLSAHPTVNDELPNRLACGTIVVKPNIKAFTEKGVVFDDGTVVSPVDEVVLSTGYSFEFPLAEGGGLIPVEENNVSLYLYMYPPELADHNTLAVLGLIQPLGSIMPISEMQARLFFDALSGHAALPNKEGMMHDIIRKRNEMRRRYVASRRHTIQVDYDTYMDDLAAMMGCHPSPIGFLLTDPVLAYRLFFGANAPYVFRLRGPHAWTGARDAIVGLNSRVYKGMSQTRPPSSLSAKRGLEPSLIWLIATLSIFVTLCIVFLFF